MLDTGCSMLVEIRDKWRSRVIGTYSKIEDD